MSISYSPDKSDVNESSYESAKITVGTTQVEAKVGATRNGARQVLIIRNITSGTIYYGPNGVTSSGANEGLPLSPNQEVSIAIGDVGLYLIRANGTGTVIVQELG